ncbi:methyltransferase domain-containing protein [Phycomyces blakesleeanus]
MAPSAFLPANELYLPTECAQNSPEEYLDELITFFERYRHLTDIHVVDFLTYNQWELLDPEWRKALSPDPAQHHNRQAQSDWLSLMIQIASESNIDSSWPDSLQDYIKKSKALALPRVSPPGYNIEQTKCVIDRHILPGMTDKKIHEVERMSALINNVAETQNIKSIIDLGAGQGYLSRALAFQHHLKVLAVDSSTIQTCGAKKFDEKAMKGYKALASLEIHHVTDTMSPQNASDVLARWSNIDRPEDWLVCGLHACGDLTSLMLRMFTESNEMKCLVNVGCCYHFLTETEDESTGFPMSRVLKSKGYRLGSTACMLACQAPSRWQDKEEESLKAFGHHFFRALLQFIMVEKGLASADSPPIIGRLNKKKDFLSFGVYVQAALKRLNIPTDSISVEEAEEYYHTYKDRQVDKQIAILWTLRALLAPVLESIILVDRWIYLKDSIKDSKNPEKGVWVWPLFDSIVSPRNVVIVATK